MTSEPGSVLAIYPASSGYAFAFFQQRGKLLDFAVRLMPGSYRRRNAKTMADILKALAKYQPDSIVLEDWAVAGSRRSVRIRKLHRSIVQAADARSIDVIRCTRDEVRKTFASVGARSRHDIARAVGREFPALAFRLPQRRKPWESERSVMGLFAAVALGVTHYRASEHAAEEQ